jgi:hypothetical protein
MVKSNPSKSRKTRLDVPTTSYSNDSSRPASFIGFGAFAAATTASPRSVDDGTPPAAATEGESADGLYQWTPLYMGPDETFRTIFTRIYQKRDMITLCKALQELQGYILETSSKKKLLVEAMKHYAYLYYTKLAIGMFTTGGGIGVTNGENAFSPTIMISSATLRASALRIWLLAYQFIPKAILSILSSNSEILGMIYATRTDPATEVRNVTSPIGAADASCPSLLPSLTEASTDSLQVWHDGILAFTSRILSYGRPTVLYEALCNGLISSTTEQKSQGNKNDRKASDALNEQQRDTIEELYVRLVGNCLDSIGQWLQILQKHPQLRVADTWSDRVTVWFKPFTSSATTSSKQHSIRRKSYELLAKLMMNSTELAGTSASTFQKVITLGLSTEKDSANIPILLEAVLSTLAHSSRVDSDVTILGKNNTEAETKLAQTIVKPLKKVLQKACYGAKVDLWGPSILPLIGQYKLLSNQHQILSAVQSSLPLAFGLNDKYNIWTAICESSSYILLRKTAVSPAVSNEVSSTKNGTDRSTSQNADDMAVVVREIASLWIDGFQFLISTPVATSSSGGADKGASARSVQILDGQMRFVRNISSQLMQFDQAMFEGRNCLFVNTPNLVKWFWGEGIVFNVSSHDDVVEQLLRAMQNRNGVSPDRPVLKPLLAPLKELFHARLVHLQNSSSSVPPKECYQFFQAVVDYFGPRTLFELQDDSPEIRENTSLERFVMNDLLRWTVIHTSVFRTEQNHEQSEDLVVGDFLLLSSCLIGLQNTKRTVWESFLRELISAKCNLSFLVMGLSTLIKQNGDAILDLLPCDSLNSFAANIGSSVDDDYDDEEHGHEDHFDDEFNETLAEVNYPKSKKLEFFRVCLGLSSPPSPVIVSMEVILGWIDTVNQCSMSLESEKQFHSRTLLVSLLETIEKKHLLLGVDEMNRILLASWNCSDRRIFNSYSVAILSSDVVLREGFRSTALQRLRDDFNALLEETSEELIENWTQKAWFLSLLCSDDDLPLPLLGFERIAEWKNHPSLLFHLSMSLFRHFQNIPDRLVLVKSWASDDFATFVVNVATALSEASGDVLLSVRCRERRDRCAEFLAAIGCKTMDVNVIECLVNAVFAQLSSELEQDNPCDDLVRVRVAVLSQLLEFMFEPHACLPVNSDEFSNDEIREGDDVWYISDPSSSEIREKAEIVKVHFDSQTGYFYTISVLRMGKSQERQTVIERLRKNHQASNAGSNTEHESSKRKRLRDDIWKGLLAPNLLVKPLVSLGELVHVLAVQIGFGDDRGIGSVYYEIFRFIGELDQRISAAMIENDDEALVRLIWTLSLSVGFELNTPGSFSPMSSIWSISVDWLVSLLDYLKNDNLGHKISLSCAVAGLLAGSGVSALKIQAEDNSLFERLLMLLFHVSFRILDSITCSNKEYTGYASLVCRTLSEGISICSRAASGKDFLNRPAITQTIEDSISLAIRSFSIGWEAAAEENPPFSSFQQLVRSGLASDTFSPFFSESSLREAEGLRLCLFTQSKRNLAFQLLDAASSQGKPYVDSANVVLAETTLSRLKAWTNILDEEEATILEEDIYIVAEWVPPCLMTEIEGWADSGFEMDNDATIIGRLLSWFCVLRFVDSASPLNFRNRPAFVTYIGKCDAASTILNLGLLHNELINDKKRKCSPWIGEVADYLEENYSPDITQLATLSLFRTVEVLPSLCKRWWEEDCPTVYTSAVQTAIEKYVAPEILKRELDRLKSATSFGKMSVSASLISREVTATYIQDDFSLRVLITLPASFPFRSAIVDCSKTLGVPQNRWKRWSLQITLMLNTQGGTLQDALMLWKDNVDKEFEGVEPCPVCYSVLHVKTHKLPTLECKTCHNRFHFECLSEWFRSSGKGQCVLCQQPWQGTRIQ